MLKIVCTLLETSQRLVRARGRFAVCAVGLAMAGCGLGPLPSSYDGPATGAMATASLQTVAAASTGVGELHSTNCPGLDMERQERLRRIAGLQTTLTAELANPPTTLAHALLRATNTPEEGTLAHKQIMEERSYLSSIAAAGARIGCPPSPRPDARPETRPESLPTKL